MSLLAILASSPETQPLPSPGGAPPPPGDSALLAPPILSDATVMAMRPTSHAATFVVAQDGTGDYTTLQDAFAAAKSLRQAMFNAEQTTTPLPRHRILFLVKPGTYSGVGNMGPVEFSTVIATDPTRGATKVSPGMETVGNTYWEGIDIANVTTTREPKYAIHHHARGTSIFTRCRLDNFSSASGGGGTSFGMDGAPGATLVFHDVQMDGSTANATNLHGWETHTEPETIIASKVTAKQGAFVYNPIQMDLATEMWVVDSTAPGWKLDGPNGKLHISGSTGTITVAGTQDTRSDWPVPVGGLSALDRAAYGV